MTTSTTDPSSRFLLKDIQSDGAEQEYVLLPKNPRAGISHLGPQPKLGVLASDPSARSHAMVQPVASDSKDQKLDLAVTPLPKLGAGRIEINSGSPSLGSSWMKMMRGRNKFSRTNPYATRLVARYTGSGSSGTDYNPVAALQLNSSSAVTEAAGFAALFDEMRCTRVTFHIRARGSGSEAVSNSNSAWAFVYDPGNSGAYTSVAGVLIGSQHVGPIHFNTGTPSVGSLVETPTGYHRLVAVPPKPLLPTAGSSAVNEEVGSGWFATSDTSATAGYLKGYMEAVASTIISFDAFAIFDVEYANRT